MKRQEAADADAPSKRQRAERSDDICHLLSCLQYAVLPDTVASISGVMRLMDEFAMTLCQATEAAGKCGDLSTLTRIMQREDASHENFGVAFTLAARRGDLKAVDAIAEHDVQAGQEYLQNYGVVESELGDAMERGDRETAMHIWDHFFGDCIASQDSTVGGIPDNLVGAAIKFGYPVILEVMLLSKVAHVDEVDFDPWYDELGTHLKTVVELGDTTSLNLLCNFFPVGSLEWAIRNSKLAVLRVAANYCSEDMCVEACVDAIADGSRLQIVPSKIAANFI